MRYLVNWVPRLRNKRLFVEGDIVDLSQAAPERFDKRWCTSKIMRRVRTVPVLSIIIITSVGIRRIRMFLGLLDPDPLVRGTDPDPAPDPAPNPAPDPSLFS
jgi:hypothetical protein